MSPERTVLTTTTHQCRRLLRLKRLRKLPVPGGNMYCFGAEAGADLGSCAATAGLRHNPAASMLARKPVRSAAPLFACVLVDMWVCLA